MPRTSLALRLESLRVDAGLSQLALARRSGVSNSHISQVENGRARPSLHYLERMATALGLTLAELLGDVRYHPRRRGPQPLKPHATALRRHFRACPPPRNLATVRVVYRLAAYTRLGHELVELLESQTGRPRKFWMAVKLLGEHLNGPEQTFLLHLLTRGDIDEVRAHALGFSRPVILQPGRPSLAVVIPLEDGMLVVFPQVGIPVRGGLYYTLDFLVGASIGGRCVWFDVELDGPTHRQSQERDQRRAEALGLETIRVPVGEVDRRDFVLRLIRAVRGRMSTGTNSSQQQRSA